MTKRREGVGAGVGSLASTAHKVETVYSGDDIALGITCQLTIGERRSIVVQTHTTQAAPAAELNALLDKVWLALDRINARYRLDELKLAKKMQEDQMGSVLENNMQTRAKWEKDWETQSASGKRRGGFTLNPQQHNTHQQQVAMIERHKKEIGAIETQIRETEKLIAAG